MKPTIPFPSRGGDYRFDVKSGQLTDANAPAAEQPGPERPATTPQARSTISRVLRQNPSPSRSKRVR